MSSKFYLKEKITQGQVEFWLGSDRPLKEAIETLTDLANGNYTDTPHEDLKQLSKDVLETCDSCGFEEELEEMSNG